MSLSTSTRTCWVTAKLLLSAGCLLLVLAGPNSAMAGVVVVTGDPAGDQFTSYGNSLDNGVYVRDNSAPLMAGANYGYETYGAGFTIETGSNLVNGTTWKVGDTVLAVGGKFASTTPADAGWSAFTGNSVNSLLSASTGPKLQVKFGNRASTWTTSTIAPGAGNGEGSLLAGAGPDGVAIQIRTGTGYTQVGGEYVPGGNNGYLGWDNNAGELMQLGKSSYVSQSLSGPGKLTGMDFDVGRVIWTATPGDSGYPSSWELFLNVSLIERRNPDFAGLLPAIGDQALLTVQNNDAGWTDALVHAGQAQAVPEASSIFVWGILTIVIGSVTWVRRQQLSAA